MPTRNASATWTGVPRCMIPMRARVTAMVSVKSVGAPDPAGTTARDDHGRDFRDSHSFCQSASRHGSLDFSRRARLASGGRLGFIPSASMGSSRGPRHPWALGNGRCPNGSALARARPTGTTPTGNGERLEGRAWQVEWRSSDLPSPLWQGPRGVKVDPRCISWEARVPLWRETASETMRKREPRVPSGWIEVVREGKMRAHSPQTGAIDARATRNRAVCA